MRELVFAVVPDAWPVQLRGFVIRLSVGLCEAIGGAHKDATREGFDWHKFASQEPDVRRARWADRGCF